MKPQIIKALILFLSLQMSDSEPNPWHVDSLQAFWYLKCPECAYDTQEEEIFREHALENHPRSFAIFGKTLKEEDDEYDENAEYEEGYDDTM